MSETNIMDDDQFSEIMIDLENGTEKEEIRLNNLYTRTEEFSVKLDEELDKIRKMKELDSKKDESNSTNNTDNYFSNSPLTMSLSSSPQMSDSDSIDNYSNCSKNQFKRSTYEDIEKSLNKHFTKDIRLTNQLELLITYLKGQSHLFNQAKHITSQKFDFLMFPALFITGALTVVAPFMNSVGWSGWVVSVLNAILTIVITLNNFMKWQAVAAIYQSISYQYDKLYISVEMEKNQFLFIDNMNERETLILNKMKETEKRIMDIQYTYNDINMPYEVQLLNPIIYHMNIFSFIQKIELHKRDLIKKYKDVKNEIKYILYKWEKKKSNNYEDLLTKSKDMDIEKMQNLIKKKEEIKDRLINNNNSSVYSYIDTLYTREKQFSSNYYTYHSVGMYIIFRPKQEIYLDGNIVVDEYLKFIFKNNNILTGPNDTKDRNNWLCYFK